MGVAVEPRGLARNAGNPQRRVSSGHDSASRSSTWSRPAWRSHGSRRDATDGDALHLGHDNCGATVPVFASQWSPRRSGVLRECSELGIGSRELLEAADASDPPVLDVDDLVTVADGGETVGDEDDREAAPQPFQRRHQDSFGGVVQSRGSLVEDEYLRASVQSAGDRDPLTLTPGDTDPSFPDDRVQPVGEARDEPVQLCQLDGFVASLPDGLDTVVGERGVRVSGGQRQRVAIARALYRRPEVLIFDEGTSALDNTTEAVLMSSLERLRGHLTVVLVAHRLSTVRNCDQVVYIEDGRIAGIGSFQELAATNAEFRSLAGNV